LREDLWTVVNVDDIPDGLDDGPVAHFSAVWRSVAEVYRTSNHLTVTTYFDEHGNICREHIESEDRGRRMSDSDVNTVLNEIAPKSARGNYKGGTFLNLRCLPHDDCAGVSEDYERLMITKIGSTNEYR